MARPSIKFHVDQKVSLAGIGICGVKEGLSYNFRISFSWGELISEENMESCENGQNEPVKLFFEKPISVESDLCYVLSVRVLKLPDYDKTNENSRPCRKMTMRTDENSLFSWDTSSGNLKWGTEKEIITDVLFYGSYETKLYLDLPFIKIPYEAKDCDRLRKGNASELKDESISVTNAAASYPSTIIRSESKDLESKSRRRARRQGTCSQPLNNHQLENTISIELKDEIIRDDKIMTSYFKEKKHLHFYQ